MTSSHKLTMSKHWLSWFERNKIPLIFFTVSLIHGSILGLSDDEAYYWVLAQKPSLGYAYHPPAVAWFIAGVQTVLGWVVGNHHSFLIRLPAVLSSTLILLWGLNWLEQVGLKPAHRNRAAGSILSFCGFFALSWMMVPDIPLFVGWMVLFLGTWNLCYGNYPKKSEASSLLKIGVGAALLLLSKYSGILAVGSSFLSIWIWASPRRKWKGTYALLIGAALGVIPALIWNYQHEWASLLYQIRDRHGGGSLSWIRYLRFWAIEVVLAGPLVVGLGGYLIVKSFKNRKSLDAVTRYLLVWTVPAAFVFCTQPLFSDFKPHWAFVVWWPLVLALAWRCRDLKNWKWIKYQVAYGVFVGCFVLISCHLPIGSWLMEKFSSRPFDPRLDVTNDFYGWKELPKYIQTEFGKEISALPVVGSRYQTASQLSFSVGKSQFVTLLPRDIKERDEWPQLQAVESQGPHWPKLKSAVLFVGDNRYDAPPEFPQAECKKLKRFEKVRFGMVVKWMDIWKCDPRSE